ncbi:hypothetical protein LCGC14_1532590 [marine sediment metagenome]|uniref:Uncharacterized protein n=1 Tax=marine sediment metagenome TaxID=412755 RepID=A0A0F9IVN8_9ZZZZ
MRLQTDIEIVGKLTRSDLTAMIHHHLDEFLINTIEPEFNIECSTINYSLTAD